ncbi:RnfH family protein [Amphibiibacter pelophylacis]|uniref:RnfH family protein n=1 Tax=Amphibiibacter pelophylacis TaxID=1799477 RepID=A0ACC6P0D2_9BURK
MAQDAARADPAVLAVYVTPQGEVRSARLSLSAEDTALSLATRAQQQGVFPPEVDLAAALGDSAVHGPWQVGVWGRAARADTRLVAGDRLECWRALQVDPKTARHLRHASQQAAGTGVSRRRGRAPIKADSPDRA